MFKQEVGMSTNTYYEKFANRMAIYERVGGVCHTPELLALETEGLYKGQDYDNLKPEEQLKVRAVAREKFCACLFLDRSDNKEHEQLKDSIKNDYSRGDVKAFPTSITTAMQLMADFRKVNPEKGIVAAQGTAFAGAGTIKGGKNKSKRLPNEEWWKLTDAQRDKINEKRKAEREAKEAEEKKKSKSKSKESKDDDDDDESIKSLTKKLSIANAQLKAVTTSLVTITEQGDEQSDLSEEGSNHLAMLVELSPMFGNWYTQQINKEGGQEKLNLSNEVLLDSCTTHNIMCNKKFMGKNIKTTKRGWTVED